MERNAVERRTAPEGEKGIMPLLYDRVAAALREQTENRVEFITMQCGGGSLLSGLTIVVRPPDDNAVEWGIGAPPSWQRENACGQSPIVTHRDRLEILDTLRHRTTIESPADGKPANGAEQMSQLWHG